MDKELFSTCFKDKKLFDLRACWDRVDLFNKINNGVGNIAVDKKLQHKLVEEEFNELMNAETPVQVLDALCDIVVTLLPLVEKQECALVIDNYAYESSLRLDLKYALEDLDYSHFLHCLNPFLQTFKGDFFKAFEEVMDSNMSKFFRVPYHWDKHSIKSFMKSTAVETEEKYDNKFKVNTELKNMYIVYTNNETGKIVKPPFFIEPHLEQFIY